MFDEQMFEGVKMSTAVDFRLLDEEMNGSRKVDNTRLRVVPSAPSGQDSSHSLRRDVQTGTRPSLKVAPTARSAAGAGRPRSSRTKEKLQELSTAGLESWDFSPGVAKLSMPVEAGLGASRRIVQEGVGRYRVRTVVPVRTVAPAIKQNGRKERVHVPGRKFYVTEAQTRSIIGGAMKFSLICLVVIVGFIIGSFMQGSEGGRNAEPVAERYTPAEYIVPAAGIGSSSLGD